MPQDDPFDYVSVKKSAAPMEDRPTANDPFDYIAKRSDTPARSSSKLSTVTPPGGSFWTTSVVRDITGEDASSEWGKHVRLSEGLKAILPESMTHGKAADYFLRFSDRMGQKPAEVVDFFMSPLGIALAVGHLFPPTAPFAAGADFVLGGYSALRSIPHILSTIKDPSPENLADTLTDLVYAAGLIKGGKKIVRRFAGEPVPAIGMEEVRDTLRKIESPEAKQEYLRTLATPHSVYQKAQQSIYRMPALRDFASILNVPKPKLLQSMQHLVNDRINTVKSGDWRVEAFTREMNRAVPAEEQSIETMGYALQGDEPVIPLSPAASHYVKELIPQWNREHDQMLRAAYGDEISLQEAEHYLLQSWDFGGGEAGQANLRVAARLMKDNYLNNRRETFGYKEGIAKGWKPKYSKVSELIEVRHKTAVRAIANRAAANTLRDMGVLLGEDEAERLHARLGNPDGPMSWPIAVDASPLKVAAYLGGKRWKSKGRVFSEEILTMKPPRVHPDVEMAVNAMFGDRFHSSALAGAESLRAFSKQQAVQFSLFHNHALSYEAHALYTGKAIESASRGKFGEAAKDIGKAVSGTWLFNKESYKGLVTGYYEVFKRDKQSPYEPPAGRWDGNLMQNALKRGLDITTSDAETQVVKAMREAGLQNGTLLKTLKSPLRGMGNVGHIFNRSLWGFYHPGLMLDAYETIKLAELNRLAPELKGLSPEAYEARIAPVESSIAAHVNNAFGAVNLERLMLSPKARQSMAFLLFAPAWAISNLRILTEGFENATKTRLTARFVLGGALSWFVTTQLANYALSGWFKTRDKNGAQRAHFSWDNAGAPLYVAGAPVPDATENIVNIDAGYYPQSGRQRFIVWDKAAREPGLWVMHPLEMLGGKLSMPLKVALAEITGAEPGSGYPVIDRDLKPDEQNLQRLSVASELAVPFAFQPLTQSLFRATKPEAFREPIPAQMYGLPTRQGITPKLAIEAYTQAVESGREKERLAVLRSAALNHIDPHAVIQGWRRRQRSRAKTAAGPRLRYAERGGEPIPPTPPPPETR